MPAGTVISGGFPGRVAREVFPNQKCSGCLHYDGQGGRTGVCTIGLRPDNCGDGEVPEISYAPIVRGAGSYLPAMSNHPAQAPEVDPQETSALHGSGSTRAVQVHQVSLGEEHVHFVKSMLDEHDRLQKSQCLRCSMQRTHGTAPHNAGTQSCTCQTISAEVVAKAIISRMSNALKSRVSVGDVAAWVRDVAKAGFRLPAPKSKRDYPDAIAGALSKMGVKAGGRSGDRRAKRSLSDQIRVDDTGGHLRPSAAKSTSPTGSDPELAKSFYSDDWINQFKGTPLFDQAKKLCEREMEMEEKEMERSAEQRIHEKAARAIMDKMPKLEHEDWQERDSRRNKLRIAKQRLVLELAEAHQKTASVLKALNFKPHPESPKNLVATAGHGEYEISKTPHGAHRIDYYVHNAGHDHPAHTEEAPSRTKAVKYANDHHAKLVAAGR